MAHPREKIAFYAVCHNRLFSRVIQFRYVNGIPQMRFINSRPFNITGRIAVIAFCWRVEFNPFNNIIRILIKLSARAEIASGTYAFLKNFIAYLPDTIVIDIIIFLWIVVNKYYFSGSRIGNVDYRVKTVKNSLHNADVFQQAVRFF